MYKSKNFNNISYFIKSVTILHRGVLSVTFITGEGELTPIKAFTTLIMQYPTCKLHILCASLSPAQAFPPYCGLKQYNLLVQWHWFYSRTIRFIHWNSLKFIEKAIVRESLYLGLSQRLERCLTPPPQLWEQDDHWLHSDQPPLTGMGPCTPNDWHLPCLHHCNVGRPQCQLTWG